MPLVLFNDDSLQLTLKAYFHNTISLTTIKVNISPVTALVVVGRLSRSSFTAVTPIPYSVPGLNPVSPNNIRTLTDQNMGYGHKINVGLAQYETELQL